MGFEFFTVILLFCCLHWRSNAIIERGKCDLYKGSWVYDQSYPIYNAKSCPFVEKQFNCEQNGRPDKLYLKYKWKPTSCNLPRFNGQDFAQRFKGKKILFVGDSLSLSQWQSLTCMIHAALPHSKYSFQGGGNFTTFTLPDYGLSIKYHRTPFLVDLVQEKKGIVLKLDSIRDGNLWKGYDMLIFNTWHWWLHRPGTSWNFIEVGGKVYKQMDPVAAAKVALTTWSRWVDSNIDHRNTKVFYQGISPTHTRGEEWYKRGSTCLGQTRPLTGSHYPGGPANGEEVVKQVLSKMLTPVNFLDITELSQLRIDGHVSIYGGTKSSDCSHWCLAGVPDTWNELLYATLHG